MRSRDQLVYGELSCTACDLAWPHYPGDVRWKNMKTYDQYLLKSGDVMNLGTPRLTQVIAPFTV